MTDTPHTPVQIPDAAVQAAMDATDGNIHPIMLESALTAALPYLPLGFEVKKLEWEEHANLWSCAAHSEYQIARCWFDEIRKQPEHFEVLELEGQRFNTLEEAKAAAQADFKRRVRECHVEIEPQGWLYFNEDTGTEYSVDHPVSSGACPDAQDIRPTTNENLLRELLMCWKAWGEDRQEVDDLRAEIATKPVDVAAVRRQVIDENELQEIADGA